MKPRKPWVILLVVTILSMFVLGGCQNMKESEKEALFKEAEAKAVSYFKNNYELDVAITSKKLLPEMAMNEIGLEGHVQGHEEQHFSISYNYDKKTMVGFVMSPEIKEAIIANGYDPFAKPQAE